MAKTSKSDEVRPIIVKKVKKVAGGHHGGAWKVAYADFVTAMMAFFLLLWLLNVTTDEALHTIANYFDPTHPVISDSQSGAGGLMGGTSVSVDGAMTTQVQTLNAPTATGKAGQESHTPSESESAEQNELARLEEQLREQEEQRFAEAKDELEKRLRENKDLAELSKNLMIDITPEGLRIQLIDQQGKPLFPSGSAQMYDYTRILIKAVADVIRTMPNEISMRGHTDAHQYSPGARYTNWELSADRANASRRVLTEFNIDANKIENVMGQADREPLIEDDPRDARNRRITIMMLRETVKDAYERGAFGIINRSQLQRIQEQESKKAAEPYRKTPGNVYFP